jgi:hypothetical protein
MMAAARTSKAVLAFSIPISTDVWAIKLILRGWQRSTLTPIKSAGIPRRFAMDEIFLPKNDAEGKGLPLCPGNTTQRSQVPGSHKF